MTKTMQPTTNWTYLDAEYQRILPMLEKLSDDEKAPIAAAEDAFFAQKDYAPLVAICRRYAPEAFSQPIEHLYGEYRVDLKWALWSADAEYWTEHQATDALEAMKLALAGEGTAVIYTAPRKEIRFGTVVVTKSKAEVDFKAVWDSPNDLADDESQVQPISEWFEEYDGDPDDPIGAHVTRTIEAGDLETILRKVDECEADLLAEEKDRSEAFDEFKKSLGKSSADED